MTRKVTATYLVNEDTQVSCGRDRHGIWGAWFTHNGQEQRFMHQSSRDDALQLFDDLVTSIKTVIKPNTCPRQPQ